MVPYELDTAYNLASVAAFRDSGLVAEVEGQDGREIVAVARISRVHASDDRVLTMVIADAWQRRGVGARIVQTAVAVARGEGVAHLVADLAPDNVGMRDLLEELLATHTGQTLERIHTDTDRDFVMEASEALAYGIIDDVITSRDMVDRSGPIR